MSYEVGLLNRSVERSRDRRRATAAVLATIALAGVASTTSTSEKPVTRPTQIIHNLASDPVRISPNMQLTAPGKPASGVDYSQSVQAITRSHVRQDNWCDIPDTRLTTGVTPEQLNSASQIEMALSGDDYKQIEIALDSAQSTQAIQSIVVQAYSTNGVTVSFAEKLDGWVAKNVESKTVSDPGSILDDYRTKAKKAIWELTMLPEPMVSLVNKLQFIDTDSLTNAEYPEPGVDGLYTSDNSIIIRYGAHFGTVIHEFSHAAHAAACKEPTGQKEDKELGFIYEHILPQVQIRRVAILAKNSVPNKDSQIDEPDAATLDAVERRISGFPSVYSGKNEVELMAELSTTLLTTGRLFDTATDTPQLLEQAVVERLQDALPGVDIDSLVAARQRYPASDNSASPITLKQQIVDRVSPRDITHKINASPYDDTRKIPVIKINNSDGTSEFIYAMESTAMQNNGIKRTTLEIRLAMQGDNLDQPLIEKAKEYINAHSTNSPFGDMVKVNEFSGTVIINDSLAE